MMKDTFYFSHDYNARNDEKVKQMIRKHGLLAYGVYWALIEDLYNNANALRLDSEGIAYDMRVPENVIESIIKDFDLFEVDSGAFGSLSVQRRLDERNAKSSKARESANKRWHKKDANALRPQSEGNAIKERKGKESKGKEYRAFAHLSISLDEVDKIGKAGYTKEQIDNTLDAIENFKDNKKYKSLYLTTKNWIKKQYPDVGKPKFNRALI